MSPLPESSEKDILVTPEPISSAESPHEKGFSLKDATWKTNSKYSLFYYRCTDSNYFSLQSRRIEQNICDRIVRITNEFAHLI